MDQIEEENEMEKGKKVEYNSINNIDKSSRSVISKKSSLFTKKNPEEENQDLVIPYFRRDKAGDRLMEKTESKSKNKEKDNQLDKIGKIIGDLQGRHQKAKEKLQKMKEESEREHDRKCPFTPRKKNQERYQVTGNIIRRSEIWMREKRKKELQLKESLTEKEMKNCTFSPTFSSKRMSESYLRTRNTSPSFIKSTYHNKTQNSFSPLKGTRDFTSSEYEMAKRNLVSKMMNVLE